MREFFLAGFIEKGLKYSSPRVNALGEKNKRVGFSPSSIHRTREQILAPSHSLLMTASKGDLSLFTSEIWS